MEIYIEKINFSINQYLIKDFKIVFQDDKNQLYSSAILKNYSHFFEQMLKSNFIEQKERKCKLLIEYNIFQMFYSIINGEKVLIPYSEINTFLYLLDFLQIKKNIIIEIENTFITQMNGKFCDCINLDFLQSRYHNIFNSTVKYILEMKNLRSEIIDCKPEISKKIYFNDKEKNSCYNDENNKIFCKPEHIFCNENYILLLQKLPSTSSSHSGNTIFCLLDNENLDIIDGKYLSYTYTNCIEIYKNNIFINDKIFKYDKNKNIISESNFLNKKLPGKIEFILPYKEKIFYITSQCFFPEDKEHCIYSTDVLTKKKEYISNLFYTHIIDFKIFDNRIVYIDNNISYQPSINRLRTIENKILKTDACCMFPLNNILILITLKYHKTSYFEIVNKNIEKIKSFSIEKHLDIKKQQIDIIDQLIVIGDKNYLYFYNYQKNNVKLEYQEKVKGHIISVKFYHSEIKKISCELNIIYKLLVGFELSGIKTYKIDYKYFLDTQ
jgi:hypothetical protein